MSLRYKSVLVSVAVLVFVSVVVSSIISDFIAQSSYSGSVLVSRTFDVSRRALSIFDETTSVSTSNGQWSASSVSAPFAQVRNIAYRSSQDPLSSADWGPGQFLKTSAPGNSYVPGQCTWYAYNRRYQLRRPIGSFWGNGGYWHNSAGMAGWLVNRTPEVGAVVDLPFHVAVVEEIGTDNSVRVSEMNYAGPYVYSERWITNADRYWYVH